MMPKQAPKTPAAAPRRRHDSSFMKSFSFSEHIFGWLLLSPLALIGDVRGYLFAQVLLQVRGTKLGQVMKKHTDRVKATVASSSSCSCLCVCPRVRELCSIFVPFSLFFPPFLFLF